ncbi:hypothetical protein [Neorhizobium sp. NCHU2750]|uniref:hypothetical protein n=1 Tax=Neorhizobium sp. NCHU2750 TaxID=1825976 RepID=UPI000E7220DA|nr:hypothetical protein NCHU2750_17890 [Neorhizobium sp. NCHU2750]
MAYSVALVISPENQGAIDFLKPTLVLKSERDVRLFVGDTDFFISDTPISDELAAYLTKIGVPPRHRAVITTVEEAKSFFEYLVKAALTAAVAKDAESKT